MKDLTYIDLLFRLTKKQQHVLKHCTAFNNSKVDNPICRNISLTKQTCSSVQKYFQMLLFIEVNVLSYTELVHTIATFKTERKEYVNLTQYKNPNWQDAEQMAIYKHDREDRVYRITSITTPALWNNFEVLANIHFRLLGKSIYSDRSSSICQAIIPSRQN